MEVNQPTQLYDWTFRRVVWATLVLVLVASGFWLVYRFNQVLFILFIAVLIGTVLRPIVTNLHHRGLPRIAGINLVYLLMLALFIGFVFLLFPLIIEQGSTIATAMPGYYQGLREWMVNSPNILVVRLGEFSPAAFSSLNPFQQTGSDVIASAGQAFGLVTMTTKAVFFGIVILMLAFYWTLDGPRIIKAFLMLFPQDRRENISELIAAMETKVGLYIVGQGILCLVIGIMALISYLLIGLPNALVLALIAGVMEAIPMVGPLLGAVPAALVGLSLGPDRLVWVIIATIIIQQLENSLLVPRVMSKAVGVNPFVSLLAFFAFSSLMGIAGALMAIPIAAILQLLLDRFVFHPGVTEAEVSIGRDYASRLRYEAQELAQDLRKQARLKRGGSDQVVKQIDQVLDEIETITTDLDALLAQVPANWCPMTRQLAIIGAAVMTTLLAILLLWQFRIVVGYVLVSLMFAAALRPLIDNLVGRSVFMRIIWILIYLAALGSFGYLLYLSGQAVMREVELLAQSVSVQNEWRLPIWLDGSAFQQALVARLPPPGKLFEALTGDKGQRVLPALLGLTQGFGGAISDVLLILFLSIYWSNNQIHFERLWLSLLPADQRKQARGIWRTIEFDLGAYVRSELIQSLLAGLLLGLGYWLLGSPFPALLALIGAFVWLIPVVGAPLALIMPLLMGLLTSVQLTLLTTLYTLVVLVALQMWVEPRLFRRKWDNPILTLIILLAMADAFGLLGILMAPPLSAVCQILWDRLFSNRVTMGSALQISDLKERQAHVGETIMAMDGPSTALVASSLGRLAQLIDKAEPILKAGLDAGPVDMFPASNPATGKAGLPGPSKS